MYRQEISEEKSQGPRQGAQKLQLYLQWHVEKIGNCAMHTARLSHREHAQTHIATRVRDRSPRD